MDLEFTDEEWLEAVRLRSAEPWFDAAFAALMRLDEGSTDPADRQLAAPLFFGRWTDEARQLMQAERDQVAPAAQAGFRVPGSCGDTAATTSALAAVTAPVLMVGAELDPAPTPRLLAEYAGLYGNATVRIQAGAGHFPWLDDAEAFHAIVRPFLS